MSSPERTIINFFSDVAFSFDGAILGLTLAFSAVRSGFKYASNSAALNKIKQAPEVSVSDLRSLIPSSDEQSETNENGNSLDRCIVVVRGTVKPKNSGDWSNKSNVLISSETGDKALIIQRTQTYMYSGWKTLFQLSNTHRYILERSMPKQGADFLRMVPFVIVENNQKPSFLDVNMDGSRQPLPLTTVYSRLQPISSSPYAFLQALLFPEYPVGLLDVEKILPPGRDITAVGICSFNNGVPEIKSCQDLPYFLSEMTKDKMIADLMRRTTVLFWGGLIMGCLSIGILSFASVRCWNRWKLWAQQREPSQRPTQPVVEDETEDADEIPDGQLCVICVTRRRIPAFVPCGHIVCCRQCALTVERGTNPKCPVCLQTIRGSMRVYYS
ncbi:hypothetical protein AALP_AA4G019900 [Arabis alpina]|uniref:RING-type E3 ubiquitin transferase n=1 Tax=Arabis alpina TaxID=50452 RepID=A0A087H0K3_ARAAL|nr:hypothetical protein AALP_AA4G019900 [Arabis alpina]